MATTQYKGTISLTPEWEYIPNTVLDIICYKTSMYGYKISIEGPGIGSSLDMKFDNSNVIFHKVTIPTDKKKGDILDYTVTITTDSSTLIGTVVSNKQIGTKPNNSNELSYQGFIFTNDAGGDDDWNDCVVNLALYNDSTD